MLDDMIRKTCGNCRFWDRDYLHLDTEAESKTVKALCGQERDGEGKVKYKATRGSDSCSHWLKRSS